MRPNRLWSVVLCGLLATACALPEAARRSSEPVQERLERRGEGPGRGRHGSGGHRARRRRDRGSVRCSGPADRRGSRESSGSATTMARCGRSPKWRSCVISTARRTLPRSDRSTARSRTRPATRNWHYPQCIEALAGEYELSVSYYSRKTVAEDLTAKTTTTESTKLSTTRWGAEPGSVYLLAAVIGRPVRAPGERPSYRVRPRTRELWTYDYKLEVSHWKAAIVRLGSDDQSRSQIVSPRDSWRRHESSH